MRDNSIKTTDLIGGFCVLEQKQGGRYAIILIFAA